MLAISHLEPALGPVRTELAMASTEQLADCIATSDDIGVRSLAGTARYSMNGVPRRQGDLAAVWKAARELDVPADWLLLVRAARRIRWPLAVLLVAYVSMANATPILLTQATSFETWRGVAVGRNSMSSIGFVYIAHQAFGMRWLKVPCTHATREVHPCRLARTSLIPYAAAATPIALSRVY
jgi:hypothetical protein